MLDRDLIVGTLSDEAEEVLRVLSAPSSHPVFGVPIVKSAPILGGVELRWLFWDGMVVRQQYSTALLDFLREKKELREQRDEEEFRQRRAEIERKYRPVPWWQWLAQTVKGWWKSDG
jgi:hypothetical protein